MTGTGTQGTPCIGNCRANKRKESQTCETLQRETTARGAMTQSQLAACRTRCGRAGGSGHENGASQASQLTGSPSQTCSPKAHRAPPWAHEGPEPNLTLCHHCVEVFNKGPTFSFCTLDPCKLLSSSCQLKYPHDKEKMNHHTHQQWGQVPSHPEREKNTFL